MIFDVQIDIQNAILCIQINNYVFHSTFIELGYSIISKSIFKITQANPKPSDPSLMAISNFSRIISSVG